MKTLIIEDERKNITHVKSLLSSIPQVELMGEATNAAEAERLIGEVSPELILLDIQLPDKNGFELLASLGEYRFEVIFITAHDQYGIQAIKCSALDYLLKPVKLADLTAAIDKAAKRKDNKQVQYQIQNLLSIMNHPPKEHRIAIQLMKEVRFVDPVDIIRCEAANNYTHIYLKSGEKLIASKGLFEFAEILKNYHFIRCHQSHLVNRKYIKSLLSKDMLYELQLTEKDIRIPVSRLKKDIVKLQLLKQDYQI